MKAIIVAAGLGSRLNPITNERPKCLLEVGSQTMLERALVALRGNGIENIVVVRGYCGTLALFITGGSYLTSLTNLLDRLTGRGITSGYNIFTRK